MRLFSGTDNHLITQQRMQNWTKGHIFLLWLVGQLMRGLQNQTTVFHIKGLPFPSILERKKPFISVSNGLICWVFLCCRQFFFFIRGERKIRHDSHTRARLKKQISLILHSLSSSYQTAGAEKSPEERSAVPVLIKTPETRAGGEEKQIVHRLREQGGWVTAGLFG